MIISLPDLPVEYEPTRQTLHAYARSVSAVTRAHGIEHPRWWHVALRVHPDGLVTRPVPLPGGRALGIRMDLARHLIVARCSSGEETVIDLRSGATGTEVADAMIVMASGLGLDGTYDRARFEDEGEREYDPSAAEAYFTAFTAVAAVLERRRVTLGPTVGPVQLWPHGFDLAFEWFGEEAGGEVPQINLGFYPGHPPYFYSSPWPFDEGLTEVPLSRGAVWNTDGWEGAMIPYDTVRGGDAAEIISGFGREVFETAAPTLPTP